MKQSGRIAYIKWGGVPRSVFVKTNNAYQRSLEGNIDQRSLEGNIDRLKIDDTLDVIGLSNYETTSVSGRATPVAFSKRLELL